MLLRGLTAPLWVTCTRWILYLPYVLCIALPFYFVVRIKRYFFSPARIRSTKSLKSLVQQPVPALLTFSAQKLASLIRNGTVTSQTVTQQYIKHIFLANVHINAMVAYRFSEAIDEAVRADETIAAARNDGTLDALPPLIGVPCTIKECISVNGMPNTCSVWSRRTISATSDAIVVAKLRQAGAIVLGVTNQSEYTMSFETESPIYGITCNPHNLSCIPGGSSGGEGAAVSACFSAFGIGSDIGGSVRIPAGFCGLFSHKPTGGVISNYGMYPPSHNTPIRINTLGPLVRHAEDLWPLFKLMAGVDPQDETTVHHNYNVKPINIHMKNVRVGIIEDIGIIAMNSPESEVVAAVRAAANFLVTEQHATFFPIQQQDLPNLWKSDIIYGGVMVDSARLKVHRNISDPGQKRRLSILRELIKSVFYTSQHNTIALYESFVEKLPVSKDNNAELAALRAAVVELLGKDGVILMPTHPRSYMGHGEIAYHPLNYMYTGIWNMLELPVTQVPMGRSSHTGMPIGIQVIGGPFNDALTIAVALQLEQKFGGWVAPVSIEKD